MQAGVGKRFTKLKISNGNNPMASYSTGDIVLNAFAVSTLRDLGDHQRYQVYTDPYMNVDFWREPPVCVETPDILRIGVEFNEDNDFGRNGIISIRILAKNSDGSKSYYRFKGFLTFPTVRYCYIMLLDWDWSREIHVINIKMSASDIHVIYADDSIYHNSVYYQNVSDNSGSDSSVSDDDVSDNSVSDDDVSDDE